MGFRSFLGLGSSNSSGSSDSGSSGPAARTSGMSTTGWHPYDPATAQRHHREAQVSLPEATYTPDGQRVASPDPYNQPGAPTARNFGRPHSSGGGAR
ncbi:hypothetical protein [Kitasatospora sp. NPDC058218]|uniref:hypothetical protein n=1 Tax=Kitasatospora sp. NPDC058218 TaxID=3346385 RepID=UPI0036DB9CEE